TTPLHFLPISRTPPPPPLFPYTPLFRSDRAERAPTAEELFSDGPHIATASHEVGNAGLDTERAFNAELGLHLHHGRLEAKAAIFRTRYDGFIYLADTMLAVDELPLRTWTQADARCRGWEAEARLELHDGPSGLWRLRAFADAVDARLDSGERLPRIAPARAGVDLEWSRDGWRARLGAVRVAKQDEVAPRRDRKSTRLNSSHVKNSYAVFCLKKKTRGQATNAVKAGSPL